MAKSTHCERWTKKVAISKGQSSKKEQSKNESLIEIPQWLQNVDVKIFKRKNKRMRPKSLTGKTCQKWKHRIVVTEFSDEKLFSKMIFIFPSLIYFNICHIAKWSCYFHLLEFSFRRIDVATICADNLWRPFFATIWGYTPLFRICEVYLVVLGLFVFSLTIEQFIVYCFETKFLLQCFCDRSGFSI